MRTGDGFDFEQFTESASGTFWSKVLGGFVVPIALCIIGLVNIVMQYAILPQRGNGWYVFQGTEAVLLGVAKISFGGFLHSHYYWTVSQKLWEISNYAKIVTISLFAIFILWLVSRCLGGL